MQLGHLDVPDRDLDELCRRWKIRDLSVFGSALRDVFGPASDIDLLVTFAPDAPWTVLDLVAIRDDFEVLLGRSADLIERSTVETSPIWIRRREIWGTARPIHVAG